MKNGKYHLSEQFKNPIGKTLRHAQNYSSGTLSWQTSNSSGTLYWQTSNSSVRQLNPVEQYETHI
jgi:hypothetical protein